MKAALSLFGFAAGLLLAGSADACSICRCGDPTFNALGKEGVSQTGFRLALDWDEVKKTQGVPDEEFESLRERRTTLLLAYGLSDNFGLFARIPYSERDLTETADGVSERVHTSGLADPELYGQARLWASDFDGEVGVRSSFFAVFGVKTPWGSNDLTRDGERLDEHVQPGTGATDWFGGLSASYQLDRHSALFASAQYRVTGRNDSGYRYGRSTLLNVAYERKLAERWDGVLEANFRHAGRDEIDSTGTTDPDTGGSITYLTPRILFDVGGGWVLRGSAQVPLSDSGLKGRQDEKTVFNIGVTRLIGK